MEIRKLELNLGNKVANPFKTTRKSTTNPFKYNDFEGNTIDPLVCADVLVSFKGKESKLKMITASVMGSMTKLRNSITEPIINFVNRVKDGITGAWNHAKNTNIEIAGLKNISEGIHNAKGKINDFLNYDIGKGISDSISGLGKHLSERLTLINDGVTGIGKDLSTTWTSLIGKIQREKITSDKSVAELKELWIKENEAIAAQNAEKEIAIQPAITTEVKVA